MNLKTSEAIEKNQSLTAELEKIEIEKEVEIMQKEEEPENQEKLI